MQPNSQQPRAEEKPRPRSWCSKLFVAITNIPVIGDSLRILNTYTYDGDTESDLNFAPFTFWMAKHWFSILFVAVLTVISTTPVCLKEVFAKYGFTITLTAAAPSAGVGSLILSILPNLLGFGIGVYALIFSLSGNFIKSLQEQIQKQNAANEKSKGHALLLNVDMAYPLLVIAITIGIGVIQQIYPESRWLITAGWIALWYSFLMIFEILFALYSLGEREVLNKLK